MKIIFARHIGEEVYRLLNNWQIARVMGNTSKGIFAINQAKDVFFISYDRHKSPITISLGNAAKDLQDVALGEEIALSSSGLTFVNQNVQISCVGLIPWVSLRSNLKMSTRTVRQKRIRRIAEMVTKEKNDIGFSPFLSKLYLQSETLNIPIGEMAIFRHIEKIINLASVRNLAEIQQEMAKILGYGRGLTPSGDDFAVGFLLGLNRWGKELGYQTEDGNHFNQFIVKMAGEKTTSLSQSLIRLATAGQADERQLDVLDGIMTGKPSAAICARNVLAMGNSSGIDGFLGMAVAVVTSDL
jgi:hypothetical protein